MAVKDKKEVLAFLKENKGRNLQIQMKFEDQLKSNIITTDLGAAVDIIDTHFNKDPHLFLSVMFGNLIYGFIDECKKPQKENE